jgi:signal transduction histidine kinase
MPSEASATMSHEIRTPMNAIWDTDSARDLTREWEYVGIFPTGGHTPVNLISDLLDFQNGGGPPCARRDQIRLQDVIDKTLK